MGQGDTSPLIFGLGGHYHGPIYAKTRPKLSAAHTTQYRRIHFTRRKYFVFVISLCNYPGGPHIAAAIWPCIYLSIPTLRRLTKLITALSDTIRFVKEMSFNSGVTDGENEGDDCGEVICAG